IQAAYRALARTHHPDTNPDPSAADRMRQLNAAYAVLSDPRRRAVYDAQRARAARAAAKQLRATGERPECARSRQPVLDPANTRSNALLGRMIVGLVIFLVALLAGFSIWLAVDTTDDRPPYGSHPLPTASPALWLSTQSQSGPA